jgi:methylated-DNA-[protein]-cysteine S-methyltransferase
MVIDRGAATCEDFAYKWVDSPVGALRLVGSSAGLAAILWQNERPNRVRLNVGLEDRHHPVLRKAERQLREYFATRRTQFTLPLNLIGTMFQRKVWSALLSIPYGETCSYAQIARLIGSPDAVRAVGAANGQNPLSIVVPCHRVVGATGKLTGFAGGLQAKAYLIAHERAALPALAAETAKDGAGRRSADT